jgi:hypothetical protein
MIVLARRQLPYTLIGYSEIAFTAHRDKQKEWHIQYER